MKKANLFLVGLVTLVAVSVGFSSCGGGGQRQSPEDHFIGTWQLKAVDTNVPYPENIPTKLTIYRDGSAVKSGAKNGNTYTSFWRLKSKSVANQVEYWIVFNESTDGSTMDWNGNIRAYAGGLDWWATKE